MHPFIDLPCPVMGQELELFSEAGIDTDRCTIRRNLVPAKLYEEALHNEGAVLSASGALIVSTDPRVSSIFPST